jgi:hypothetical protein
MQLEVFKEESQIIRKLTSSLQSQSEVLFPRAVLLSPCSEGEIIAPERNSEF